MRIFALLLPLVLQLGFTQTVFAQKMYSNPILHSDYSDPDVIRVGEEYWMTSSSFNCVPGLQILHSINLVDWDIVGAALPRLTPEECFSFPAHGNGVWAPSIRYHDGLFYIFWGDPDQGIYCVSTDDPRGRWSDPKLIIPGKGLIDPCPLWDEDGRVYLVHAWAGSRAGFKSILAVCELDPRWLEAPSTCTAAESNSVNHPACPSLSNRHSDVNSAMLSENILVFDGKSTGNPTVEGPKFYKRDGWYYIFAPAGGVKEGWQLVLRSRNIFGPYEWKKVMHQGSTDIHGPHQGGWVEDISGNSWFLHFEDRYAYGRVVHLQPMTWTQDGWCTIGTDIDGDGIGEPVLKYTRPAVASEVHTYDSAAGHSEEQRRNTIALATAPDFSTAVIPSNWQWNANPNSAWAMPCPAEGYLRLNCIKNPEGWKSLWDTPNLLLEKVVGPEMEFITRICFRPSYEGDRTGVVVMGEDYAILGVEYRGGELLLTQSTCIEASEGATETVVSQIPLTSSDIYLRVNISKGGICTFSFSQDGRRYKPFGNPFTAKAGRWIGAKIGYYATAEIQKNDGGCALISAE